MRAIYERKLQLATELGNLEGLPPLSAALAGTEHPALRRMPKTGAFVHLNEVTPPTYHALTVLTILTTLTTLTMLTMLSMLTIHLLLNEVTWRRGWSLLCIGGNQSVPWYEWQAAKRTAAHIAGVSTYKPRDHPHYRDACEVILAAEQRPEEAEARRGRSLPRARREPQQTRSAD